MNKIRIILINEFYLFFILFYEVFLWPVLVKHTVYVSNELSFATTFFGLKINYKNSTHREQINIILIEYIN